MGVLLETDREHDERVSNARHEDYEKYGEDAYAVRQIEEAVLDLCWQDYSTGKSGKAERDHKWDTYMLRYRGKFQDASDDSPFAGLNPPKIARIIDIHVARTLQVLIPDRSRMDFFQFVPEDEYTGQAPDPLTVQYGEAAANAIRNDLICGHFVRDLKRALYDYFMFGNMVMLPVWEQSIQYKFTKQPNPEYQQWVMENSAMVAMAAARNEPIPATRMNDVDGEITFTPINPYITVREAYREFDAPKVRYINVRNVFPSELDKNDMGECSSVSIYDTVRLSDLMDDEIESGGKLYANLNMLRYSDERTDVPEVDGVNFRFDESTSYVESSRKMNRLTRMGRFRLEEIFGQCGIEDQKQKDRLVKIFSDKFDWDLTKLKGWDTWFMEHVDDGRVLIRWQPSPYAVDRKPIIHQGLFKTNNHTFAEGIFDRCEPEEITSNAMQRYQMEATLKHVRPPVMIIPDMLEAKTRMLMGDNYEYKPNMTLRGKKGAKIQDVFQVMQYPSAPLQYAEIAASMQALNMSEAAHLPPVKMGSASGGATASEVNGMSSSADIMLQEFALDIEDNLLQEALAWVLMLHHQLTEEPRVGYQVDPAGKVVMEQVGPEVWTKMYRVNLIGFQQVGNRAVRAMNLKEYYTWLQASGRINWDTAAVDYGKALDLKNAAAYIAPPPPPPPAFEDKMSASYPIRFELLPPSLQAKMLAKIGIECDDADLAGLGAIKQTFDDAAVYEATMEREKMNGGGQGGPGMTPPVANGGSPGGVPESNPSNYASGTHHAPGEQENRQRGVHDEKGATAAMSQKLRNPAAGRRANP